MTTSVLASFTICGLLKINLAQIPQEAYPFVVLTIGLENMSARTQTGFRLHANMTTLVSD